MYRFTPDCAYMQEGWEKEVDKIKNLASELGMQFVQAHSQGGNPLNHWETDFIVAATLRSIEICARLGIKNTVVHPGCRLGLSKEEWFKECKAFYDKLLPTAEKFGVNVLCENSTQACAPGYYWANSGKDMREFIEYVNHPNFHVCWDTGHANCEGSQYDEIMALGEHLYAIHYNDNHGNADEHILPYFGTLNHDEVMHALIDVGFKGYFTLECDSSLRQPKSWLGDRREFKKDERAIKPPAFMQQDLEKLLYKTAKYLLETYDLFEE
jgi:sugar phosphate isomerase/epimerase